MKDHKIDAETVLADVRRRLASATTAAEILAAGAPLTALVERIDDAISEIDDEISTEADNLDRSRTAQLRAEKLTITDLLIDAENLSNRVGEKCDKAKKDEADASMQAVRASALAACSDVYSLIVDIEADVRNVVGGFLRYRQLVKDIDLARNQLRAAGREDLLPPLLWKGIAQAGDELSRLFDFLDPHDVPNRTGENFFHAADRIRAASVAEIEAQAPAGGRLKAFRTAGKRAS